MRKLLNVMAVVFVVAFPAMLLAQECSTVPVKTSGGSAFSAVDISSGSVTTGAIQVAPGAEILLRVDLVDTAITSARYTFTESDTATGTFRVVGSDCAGHNPLTCEPLELDWVPSVDGKNFSIPIPAAYRWIKITSAFTGHGSGDTESLELLVCS